MHLWDKSIGWLTDFTIHFSFIIASVDGHVSADGLTFFIAPFGSDMSQNSASGYLGLFNYESAVNAKENQIFAVEFDTLTKTGGIQELIMLESMSIPLSLM